VLEDRGIKKGILQGIERGVERTAMNMLNDGDEYSKIARVTELNVERIMELDKQRLVSV